MTQENSERRQITTYCTYIITTRHHQYIASELSVLRLISIAPNTNFTPHCLHYSPANLISKTQTLKMSLMMPLSSLGLNLPLPTVVHATSMLAVGVNYLLKPLPAPSVRTREHELRTTLGSGAVSLGLAYILSAYKIPLENNVFLRISVPMRLLTVAILGAVYARDRQNMSEEGRGEMKFVIVWDLAMSIWLGWYLQLI